MRRLFGGGAGPVDWLVVGLGNPGERYARTPHNVGFAVAEELARRWELPKPKQRYAGLYTDGRTGPGGPRVAVLWPQTYMNEAGNSAGPARGALHLDLDRVLEQHEVEVEPRLLLVHLLRDKLALTGTHVGCDTTNCGACTVHLDGDAVKSCTVLAVQADGAEVTTIEGMADGDKLHPLQEAFWNDHGLQCGYCTPGMIMAAADLLQRNPDPTEEAIRHGLEGNLCRCTGYHNIVRGSRRPPRRRRGMMAVAEESGTWVGRAVPRKEDARLLTGEA